MDIAPPGLPTAPVAPRTPATGPRPAVAPIVRQLPKPVARIHIPDVTGLYEHLPVVDGENAAVLLQLNQAGAAIVGWFCAPPSVVSNVAATLSRPTNENPLRMPNGVLFGNRDDQGGDGIPISWLPGRFEVINPLDPDDALDAFRQPIQARPHYEMATYGSSVGAKTSSFSKLTSNSILPRRRGTDSCAPSATRASRASA